MSGLWGWVPLIGMVVIIVAVLWAMMRNRGTPREVAETEAATRANYDAQDAEDKARDQDARL